MNFKLLLLMCACFLFLPATGLQAQQSGQEAFIQKFGFTPGWYVQCRGRTTQGCQVAKDAVLSDPNDHKESMFIFMSNGYASASIYGEALPEGSKLDFRREGDAVRLNIRVPNTAEQWSFFFKPGLDYLESLNDDNLYILVLDEVSLQSAG